MANNNSKRFPVNTKYPTKTHSRCKYFPLDSPEKTLRHVWRIRDGTGTTLENSPNFVCLSSFQSIYSEYSRGFLHIAIYLYFDFRLISYLLITNLFLLFCLPSNFSFESIIVYLEKNKITQDSRTVPCD